MADWEIDVGCLEVGGEVQIGAIPPHCGGRLRTEGLGHGRARRCWIVRRWTEWMHRGRQGGGMFRPGGVGELSNIGLVVLQPEAVAEPHG